MKLMDRPKSDLVGMLTAAQQQTQRDAAVIESLRAEAASERLKGLRLQLSLKNSAALLKGVGSERDAAQAEVDRDAAVIADLVAAASVQCHCGSNAAHEAARAVIAKHAAESRAEAGRETETETKPLSAVEILKSLLDSCDSFDDPGFWIIDAALNHAMGAPDACLESAACAHFWNRWLGHSTHQEIQADFHARRAQRLKREAAGPEVKS